MEKKNTKFSITERIIIASLLPEKDNIQNMTIVSDIEKKIVLSQKEIKDSKYQIINVGGKINVNWDPGCKILKEIEFSAIEKSLLKEFVNRADEKKEVTKDMLPVFNRIKEL